MTKYVNTRGNHRTYHTDEDCQYLTDGNYREAYTGEIDTHDLDECKRCADTNTVDGGENSDFNSFRYEAHNIDE